MLDFISVVCWAMVYILVIFCTKNQKEIKRRAMPLLPAILNLSWEVSALIKCQAFWGHVIWFSLSIMVFESCLESLNKKRQVIYFICFIISAIFFSVLFWQGGMLISSFIINVVMSVCFWFDRKNLLLKGKIWIAIFKFIGTLAATIYYIPKSILITMVGIPIVIFDVLYLIYCVKEKINNSKY